MSYLKKLNNNYPGNNNHGNNISTSWQSDGKEKEEKEVDNGKNIVSNDNKGVDSLLTSEQLLSSLQSFAAKSSCKGDE
eukprot:9065104-Ditylum_brightwellii.AAC.1